MWKSLLLIPAVLISSHLPARADLIPSGTQIDVRPDAPIDVSRWDRGRIYPAHIARDVIARDGDIAIPRGSYAELIVRQIGPGQYVVDLESVTVQQRRYAMDTSGPTYNVARGDYDAGRGVLGAIAGALAEANGDRVEPRGAAIRIPARSLLTFRLEQPLRVVDWQDPGYNRGPEHYHRDPDWYR